MKIKIIHLITTLDIGGAERALEKNISMTNFEKFTPLVISLSSQGRIGKSIKEKGVQVISLNLNPIFPNPKRIWTLLSTLKSFRPHILHCWMYHSCFIASILKPLFPKSSIIWDIHNTNLDWSLNHKKTVILTKLMALLSSFSPQSIVYHSYLSKKEHERIYFNHKKSTYIPNGFDLNYHKLLKKEKHKSIYHIGFISRFHPLKDIDNFLNAVSLIANEGYQFKFICCGQGLSKDNPEWVHKLKSKNLENYILSYGIVDDLMHIYASLDILTLSSIGEAFPNVIGEAMSCGIPCVSTDSGDTKHIIGETGIIVPIQNPRELANAWIETFNWNHSTKEIKSQNARKRIESQYSIHKTIQQYEELYINYSKKIN